jgi:Flp pilus assembly protein TadB
MLRMMVGITVGFVGGYLYGSERARDEARRRLASAPGPVRQATERLSGVISGAPVPDAVKQAATRATAAVQTATERAADAAAAGSTVARPSPAEVGGRPAEPLPRYEAQTPPG